MTDRSFSKWLMYMPGSQLGLTRLQAAGEPTGAKRYFD
jgi:hypothetical protein